MNYYTITDLGKIRKNNEDDFENIVDENYSLFIVADGMGGHNAGEVASKIAVKSVSKYLKENIKLNNSKEKILETLKRSLEIVNKEILFEASKDINKKEMGATIVVCLFIHNTLYYANSGDSRIYLFSDNKLKQITKDHSYVQQLVDLGVITPEAAKVHAERAKITSALGAFEEIQIDVASLELNKNDYILMTTDGLTDMIDDEDIEDVFKDEYNPRETAEILVYMANATGGRDNITVTVIKND